MRELLALAINLLVTFAKLLGPGGVRAVAAESLLLEQPGKQVTGKQVATDPGRHHILMHTAGPDPTFSL
jgi:hypothetical protein